VASAIRLDDTDWSEHVMRDSHGTIPPRVSGLRLRIQECVAFAVLVSNATRWAHPTGPTGMFQAIISTAAQGQTIPTEGIPADATMEGINTTVMGNPQIQTTTDTTTDEGEKGALYGTPPLIFNGDKTKTEAFSLAVKAWRAVNWRKAVMRNPYTRTALILNYIKGKNINDWASHQFDLLLARTVQGISKKDEQLWDLFIVDFKTASLDITHKQMAYTELVLRSWTAPV
jgi:hypothetical protein